MCSGSLIKAAQSFLPNGLDGHGAGRRDPRPPTCHRRPGVPSRRSGGVGRGESTAWSTRQVFLPSPSVKACSYAVTIGASMMTVSRPAGAVSHSRSNCSGSRPVSLANSGLCREWTRPPRSGSDMTRNCRAVEPSTTPVPPRSHAPASSRMPQPGSGVRERRRNRHQLVVVPRQHRVQRRRGLLQERHAHLPRQQLH